MCTRAASPRKHAVRNGPRFRFGAMGSWAILAGLMTMLLLALCAPHSSLAAAKSCSLQPPGDVDVPCLEISHCSSPPVVVSNFTVMGKHAGLPPTPVEPEPTSASICYTDEVRTTHEGLEPFELLDLVFTQTFQFTLEQLKTIDWFPAVRRAWPRWTQAL